MKKILPLIFFAILFCSCANQLPPSGGDDDRIPPKIISITPKANSVNYKGNSVKFKFDEYVDRRSFEEAFFVSPKPRGDIDFNWSGKEVEVEFSEPLDKNKTYVVIVGKDLKDVRGSNPVAAPVTFAFSTGPVLDQGKLLGRVFSDNIERIKVLAFITDGMSEEKLDPAKYPADYLIQLSSDGTYALTNLPKGKYRVFALQDEDRNNLFDKEVDKISVSYKDLEIISDSGKASTVNFLLKDFDGTVTGRDFIKDLKADSANYVFSNVANNEKNIPPDYRLYFYFSNDNLSKADIVNNFLLTDSTTKNVYRPVFNWINDSLLEVFFIEKLPFNSYLNLKIDLTSTSRKYLYEVSFKTAAQNSFGRISGKIIPVEKITSPVFLKLYNINNKFISYSKKLIDSLNFSFDEVPEGDYTMFAFTDLNDDGRYERGNPYPYRQSEPFQVFDTDIKLKGSWTVDNIFIEF